MWCSAKHHRAGGVFPSLGWWCPGGGPTTTTTTKHPCLFVSLCLSLSLSDCFSLPTPVYLGQPLASLVGGVGRGGGRLLSLSLSLSLSSREMIVVVVSSARAWG